MEWLLVLVPALTAWVIGVGRFFASRAPIHRLSQLVAIRKELEDVPASQQLLSEAIDRCSAKIVHAERAQFSGLWMTIGMVLATTGLIVMAVASTHYDGGELSWRTSEFWWPFGGWLAMVVGMGLTVMASKVTARSSVGFESLRETELHEIDERYAHRQRYRRSRSKQNLESQRHKQRVLNKKRAKAIKGLRRNRPAGNSR